MRTYDHAIEHALLLTMAPGAEPIADGLVLVRDGKLAWVGPRAAFEGEWQARERLDARGMLVMPGLVNAHTHAAMTAFRGLGSDLPLKTWLEEHVFPAEARHVGPELVRLGTRLAMAEMLLSGTTTFADMYYFSEEVAQEADAFGMRALLGEGIVRFPVPGSPTPEHGLERTQRLIGQWKGHPRVGFCVAPHAPYTTTPEILRECRRLSDLHEVPLHIHLAETRWEYELYHKEHGCGPTTYLHRLGVLGPRTLAAHAVHLDPEEIGLLASTGTAVAHNPVCNMKLASGAAPIPEMAAAGVVVGLGTDGVASNNRLDLFAEMNVAALLHKLQRGDAAASPARQVLHWATLGGARALGLGHRVGSLEVGKEADLIALDLAGPHCLPLHDPYTHLVFSARSSDLRHAMVAGRWLCRDRRLADDSWREAAAQLQTVADTLHGRGPKA